MCINHTGQKQNKATNKQTHTELQQDPEIFTELI